MKIKRIIYFILMFLPLVIAIISLFFLPERIPAHYGANSEVNRWGSKYESLIIPVMTAVFGYFILGLDKILLKKGSSGKNNEGVLLIAGIGMLLIFNVMNAYMLYAAFKQVKNLNEISVDLYSMMTIVLGAVLILIGNVMPKTKKNSIVGLRISWSMKNDVTWKKCQRFGGITFIIAGVLMILCGAWIHGAQVMLYMLAIVLVTTMADVIYAYQVARKY